MAHQPPAARSAYNVFRFRPERLSVSHDFQPAHRPRSGHPRFPDINDTSPEAMARPRTSTTLVEPVWIYSKAAAAPRAVSGISSRSQGHYAGDLRYWRAAQPRAKARALRAKRFPVMTPAVAGGPRVVRLRSAR